jgi:hypothetical protein
MTLALDPEPGTYTEPPYTSKQPVLYTLAAPFGDAINHWLDHQTKLAGGCLHTQGGRSNGTGMVPIAGLSTLADMAGIPIRSLSAWRTGERKHIELTCADRLALALDIPLPLLATEFKTLRSWRA